MVHNRSAIIDTTFLVDSMTGSNLIVPLLIQLFQFCCGFVVVPFSYSFLSNYWDVFSTGIKKWGAYFHDLLSTPAIQTLTTMFVRTLVTRNFTETLNCQFLIDKDLCFVFSSHLRLPILEMPICECRHQGCPLGMD